MNYKKETRTKGASRIKAKGRGKSKGRITRRQYSCRTRHPNTWKAKRQQQKRPAPISKPSSHWFQPPPAILPCHPRINLSLFFNLMYMYRYSSCMSVLLITVIPHSHSILCPPHGTFLIRLKREKKGREMRFWGFWEENYDRSPGLCVCNICRNNYNYNDNYNLLMSGKETVEIGCGGNEVVDLWPFRCHFLSFFLNVELNKYIFKVFSFRFIFWNYLLNNLTCWIPSLLALIYILFNQIQLFWLVQYCW